MTKMAWVLMVGVASQGCDRGTSSGGAAQLNVGEPTLNFTKGQGCGDLTVYGENDAYTEILVVSADRTQLGLSTTETTFSIEDKIAGLSVHLEQSSADIEDYKRFDICDDQRFTDVPLAKRWEAISGTVTISISDAAPQPVLETYRASARLDNVVIRDGINGQTKTLERFELKDVMVGWFPG